MLRFHLFRPRGGVAARHGTHPIAAASATNMLAYAEGDVIVDVVEHRALLVCRLAYQALDGYALVPTHYAVVARAQLNDDQTDHADPVTFRNEHPDLPKDGRPWVYVGNSAVLWPRPGLVNLPPMHHPLWKEYSELIHGTQAFDIYGRPMDPREYRPLFGIPAAGSEVKS